MTVTEKLKNFLFSRRAAYLDVFNPESKAAQVVLRDLARFCHANDSTFRADAREHAFREGRREVFLRICQHTQLSPEAFWAKYGRNDLE